MNVLILGSGGREHALGWKLRQSPLLEKLYFAPGNAGTAELADTIALDSSVHSAIAQFCREHDIGFVVPGPDSLYAGGIVDALTAEGILTFGPRRAAAEIEWSKAYAKDVMQSAGVPTATSKTFSDFSEAVAYIKNQSLPIVIKADGLALGKGVVIAKTQEEASAALRTALVERAFGDAGRRVVVEEFLEGVEISIHALCAGTEAILFPVSQDHKRALDGDQGPNTGGMGVVAPVTRISEETTTEIRDHVVLPTLRELKKRGRTFNGLLYPGIILTKDGPKVIEFNARFGDPEAQAYMRILQSDLLPALVASAKGSLKEIYLEWSRESVACIVMASAGYPSTYTTGQEISGTEKVPDNVVIFHSGSMKRADGVLVTSGGRVLSVTATGQNMQKAIECAYATVKNVTFPGAYYRKDIGMKAVGQSGIL